MKTTKEQLAKEVATLTTKLEMSEKRDHQTRETLSGLLDSYEYIQEYGYSSQKQKVLVRDWLGIAFLIGELKADANYAMCIEAREQLKNENVRLQEIIQGLKRKSDEEK